MLGVPCFWLSPGNKGRNLGRGGGAYLEMMCIKEEMYIFLETELFLQRPMLLLAICLYLNTRKREEKKRLRTRDLRPTITPP